MKSSELLPSYDNLWKTFVNDTIGRSADVIRFASMLNVIDSNFSIALDSSWGSGKTFFVKQVKMFLDANNDHVHTIPEPDKSLFQSKWSDFSRKSMPDFQPQVCVYYDAWANDGDEDPVLSLVYEIINDVESDYSLPKDGDCIKIASTVLDSFTGKNWTAVIDALRGEDPLAKIKKAKSIEEEIKNFLDSLLCERGNRLVVFVDELDRCRPSFAVKLLERIKHYFANDRITFVFSINAEELQHTIRQHYGSGFDACRYLERFFDLRVSLPPADMAKFYRSIGYNGSSFVYDKVCEAVIKKYQFSLRETAKYFVLTRVTTDNHTHGNCWTEENDFCNLIVVPIMLGLRIKDLNRYTRFSKGEDCSPLLEMVEDVNIQDSLERLLFSQNETMDIDTGKKTTVLLEERVKKAYNAIFAQEYSGRSYKTDIGRSMFYKETKNSLLRRMSLLFETANYG